MLESGRGSGGDFAVGEFAKSDRRLEFHFQWSLGLVSYHLGQAFVSHEDYMQALGVPRGANRYPRVSSDPLQAFRDLADDIHSHCIEFLSGDLRVFAVAAADAARRRAISNRVRRAQYAGDDHKRSLAKESFRKREYGKVVELLESLQDPALLDASERKALEIARRRVSG
jgi:hypothetical protein